MPDICDFWERFLQCDRIEFSMTILVHQMISSFNGNTKIDENCQDKLFKIDTLIHALKERFHCMHPLICYMIMSKWYSSVGD